MYLTDPRPLLETTAPAVAEALAGEGVGAVVVAPS